MGSKKTKRMNKVCWSGDTQARNVAEEAKRTLCLKKVN